MRVTQRQHGSPLRRAPVIVAAAAVVLAVVLILREIDRPEPVGGAVPTRAASSDAVPDTPPARPAVSAEQPDAPMEPRTARSSVRSQGRAGRSSSPSVDPDGVEAESARQRGIDARDYIAALRDRGETEGLAAFSPPGTRPPRSGVIVPDDYVLPEGFARHYQTTDDGRRLAPILIVAPDYDIVDYAGNVVPLIDGRIVPAEHAPPDLPVRMLEIGPEHERGPDAR